MTVRTGGQLLVDALIEQGVTTMFGIPGVQLDDASDALYLAADRIRFICARNEQATTYMADGYARSTGNVGVAMVVPGPGVLNALAGMATAYSANSRVLLIAGQINSEMIGKGYGALHEIPDQSGVLASLTKWSGLARRAEEIPDLVAEAFHQLRSGRPRPVSLEIPPDVLAARTDVDIRPRVSDQPSTPADADVERIVRLLDAAARPVIVAGGGVLAAGASAALTALAERVQAPVVVTENGRGAIDARHPLAFDLLALRKLRERADLVIGIGTRFLSAFGTQLDVGGATVALLNVEARDVDEPRTPDASLISDARLGLEAIAASVSARAVDSRRDELDALRAWVASSLTSITPQQEYLAVIRAALPEDGVLVSEFTQIGYAASMSFPTYHQRGYIGPGYQGTLGYGFATALGAKAADPSRTVISINGDGGFSWTMPELSTARRFDLGLITVVFNDGHFGNVRRIQKQRYGARYFATDLTNPDYEQLAQAFGIAYARAWTPAELGGVLHTAVEANEPVLIEVPVGEFPSPWFLIHEGLPQPEALAPGAHLRQDPSR